MFNPRKHKMLVLLFACMMIFSFSSFAYAGDLPLNYSQTTDSANYNIVIDNNSGVSASTTFRILFDKNVTNDAQWTANQACIELYSCGSDGIKGTSDDSEITAISVQRWGNGSQTDPYKREIYLDPSSSLSSGAYYIRIDGNLQSYNGNYLGTTTDVDFEV